MRAALVLDGILNELEARQADGVEREVVSASGIRKTERLRLQIRKRLKPAAEKRPRRLIALHIDPSDFSGAIVQIEVSAEPLVVRLAHERAPGTRVGGSRFLARRDILAARAPDGEGLTSSLILRVEVRGHRWRDVRGVKP